MVNKTELHKALEQLAHDFATLSQTEFSDIDAVWNAIWEKAVNEAPVANVVEPEVGTALPGAAADPNADTSTTGTVEGSTGAAGASTAATSA